MIALPQGESTQQASPNNKGGDVSSERALDVDEGIYSKKMSPTETPKGRRRAKINSGRDENGWLFSHRRVVRGGGYEKGVTLTSVLSTRLRFVCVQCTVQTTGAQPSGKHTAVQTTHVWSIRRVVL